MRLSIIMPVHNAMPFLPDAIASIMAQTYRAFRLVIVNDGSTDESLGYLNTLSDARVTVISRDERCGQGAARNLALAHCNTEYTAFMDADDVSLPDRLARQMRFLDEHRGIGFAGTKISYLGVSGRAGFSPPLALTHTQIREDLLGLRHALVNATLMFRTTLLHKSGGFRIDGAGEDWDFFLRMTELTRAANVDEVLYLYRIHQTMTSRVHARHVAQRDAHACECARIRCAGGVESSFEDFCDCCRERALWRRWIETLDARAAASYRTGVGEVLNEHPVAGYSRLVLAAALSPGRVAQRVRRSIRASRHNQESLLLA